MIRHSPARINYERRVYHVLDLLGDVGSLNDALALIIAVLIGPFQGFIAHMRIVVGTTKVYKKSEFSML